MIGRVPLWFLAVGILTGALGCDNVSWGGFEISLRGPAVDSTPPTGERADTTPSPLPPPMPTLGPLLYEVERDGSRARAHPVAEISPQGLRALPTGIDGEALGRTILGARLRPGAELALFHEGARAGTLVIAEAGQITHPICAPRPEASGHLELLPEAMGAQRFLALEKEEGRARPLRPLEFPRPEYEHRAGSLALASEAIREVGAPWPPSVVETRQDIQVLRLHQGEGLSVVATFLHQDQLRVAAAPATAYALLVLGEREGDSIGLAYTWYRRVGDQGKGAPRYFAHLDWDGDGEEEILLEVLGAENRWWAALKRGALGWQLDFEDPCGAPGGGG
jgi:hypothetical protein